MTSLSSKFLPTLDNLRNFLLMPTTEVLSFLQHLREAPNLPLTPMWYWCVSTYECDV